MKKTMITLAAMFVATISMAAVTSQVVGYVTKTARLNYSMMTAMFGTVGGDGTSFKLSDIKGNFADFDNLQVLDSDLNTIATYNWITFMGDTPGWFDGDMNPIGDTLVGVSTGFALTSTSGDVDYTVSGQVVDGSVEVALNQNYTVVGNPCARAITLSEVSSTGLSDFDNIQILDADLNTQATYNWITFMGDTPGWFDGDMNPAGDVVLNAGDAFAMTVTGSDPATLIFPASIQ